MQIFTRNEKVELTRGTLSMIKRGSSRRARERGREREKALVPNGKEEYPVFTQCLPTVTQFTMSGNERPVQVGTRKATGFVWFSIHLHIALKLKKFPLSITDGMREVKMASIGSIFFKRKKYSNTRKGKYQWN